MKSNNQSRGKGVKSAFDEALEQPLLARPASSSRSQKRSQQSGKKADFKNLANVRKMSRRKSDNTASTMSTSPTDSSFLEYEPPPTRKKNNMAMFLENSDDQVSGDEHETAMIQTKLEMSAQDLDFVLVRERNDDIMYINGSMKQINDIHRDLANIVDDQQEDIDDVEKNAAEIHDQAESGVKNLEASSKLQKQSNKLLLLLFSILLLVLGVAALVCFARRHRHDE